MEYLYLTEKEFVVLLSAVGCREWIGILDKNVFREWDMESEINEILVSLYQKFKAAVQNDLNDLQTIIDQLQKICQYEVTAKNKYNDCENRVGEIVRSIRV